MSAGIVLVGGLNELQQAFAEWVALMPCHQRISSWSGSRMNRYGEMVMMKIPTSWDGNCCTNMHYRTSGQSGFVSLPDQFVCAREKAWRKYIEIRDRVH